MNSVTNILPGKSPIKLINIINPTTIKPIKSNKATNNFELNVNLNFFHNLKISSNLNNYIII